MNSHHDSRPEGISVLWVPSPSRAAELDVVGIRLLPFSASPARGCVLVMEIDADSDPAEALRERQRHRGPALLLVHIDHVDTVMSDVGDNDEVALLDAPPSLIRLRLERLEARRARLVDGMTGLPDKVAFSRQLDLMRAQVSEDEPLSLLLFDIDRFKMVNDTHGHLVGDQVLRELSARLERERPTTSFLARFGGEELALLTRSSDADALELAERLRLSVAARPFTEQIDLRVSVGVATIHRPDEPLIKRADQALYTAKARGRDQSISFEALQIETELKGGDGRLEHFENMTRVVADRVAELIAYRGRKIFEELRHEVDIDAVTQIHSRRFLDRRLPRIFDLARREQAPLTLALLDIDHFGRVNKEHGWLSGDRVLHDLAQRVCRALREGDQVARYGGEELCIVLNEAGPGVGAALERVRVTVAETPFEGTSGQPIAITVSIGTSAVSTRDESYAEVLERASVNLNVAKREGRNKIVCDGQVNP